MMFEYVNGNNLKIEATTIQINDQVTLFMKVAISCMAKNSRGALRFGGLCPYI